MKKNKAAVTLLLTLALTGLLLFTAAVGWGTDGAGAAKDIKLGLDLAGGGGASRHYGLRRPARSPGGRHEGTGSKVGDGLPLGAGLH